MLQSGAVSLQFLFAKLPSSLRDELVDALDEIVTNFRQHRWEPSELNGGKLSEVTYTVLKGYIDGTFPPRAQKPPDMVASCRTLEKANPAVPRSIRVQIPRVLTALYDIRNTRGVGHVGGDVNPNHMDATAVLYMSKWVVAELVRIFHDVDTQTATEVVDSMVEREVPIIWQVGSVKRVLKIGLSLKEKMLLLLYSEPGAVAEADLVNWLERPNASSFRRDVLRPAHKAKLVEYNDEARTVQLSPLGAQYVETKLPLTAG